MPYGLTSPLAGTVEATVVMLWACALTTKVNIRVSTAVSRALRRAELENAKDTFMKVWPPRCGKASDTSFRKQILGRAGVITVRELSILCQFQATESCKYQT